MRILGIDPGTSGAATLMSAEGEILAITRFYQNTEHDTAEDFADFADDPDEGVFAYLEQVHSFPGQGVSSTFAFGSNYGFLRGVLTALKIPYQLVTPNKWQKAMGCQSKGDKKVTKAKAQQLFPNTKMIHAIADSILIAEYGRRMKFLLKS